MCPFANKVVVSIIKRFLNFYLNSKHLDFCIEYLRIYTDFSIEKLRVGVNYLDLN